MNYISTRGHNCAVTSARAIIKGLAEDGGLFVPENIPIIDEKFLTSLLDLSYQECAKKILSLYLTDFTAEEINLLITLILQKNLTLIKLSLQ